MKNKLDQHIDHAVKQSFGDLNKKAPEHLWNNISNQMDLEQDADALLDDKIQASYDLRSQKLAPLGLWDAIEEDLNHNDAALDEVDQLLDDKVKASFSNKTSAAPTALWGAIEQALPSEMPTVNVDEQLDQKVKESYLDSTQQTPGKVWLGINRQLNIDRTWDKINLALDNNPVVSDWRKRTLLFVAIGVLLLLLLRTCNYQSTDNNQPLAVQQVVNSSTTTTNSTVTKPIENKETEVKKVIKNNPSNLNQTPKTSVAASTSITTIDKNNTATAIRQKNQSTVSSASKQADLPSKQNQQEQVAVPSTAIINVNSGNKIGFSDNNKQENTETTLPRTTLQESIIVAVPLKEDKTIKTPLTLATLKGGLLDVDNTIEPIRLLDEMDLAKPKKVSPITGKLAAGAFVVVNSTMLLNNDTREGFNQNSLIQNYFGLAANYGIWVSYKILPKGYIVGEFSANADNKQAYGVFDQGVYYIKEWVLKYNRISLAYKHDLWDMNSDKKVNTKIVGEAGLYLGMLREAKLFYDGDLRFNATQDHHQFDLGFKVALGQDIIIDKFILGYGIRSDIGASNIFRGNATQSAQENKTNLIHLGGYITFGYRF